MKKMRNRNEQNESRKSQSQVASDKRRKLAARDSQQSQATRVASAANKEDIRRHSTCGIGRGLKVKSELHDRESYQFIQNIHLNNVSPAKLKITKFFVKNDAPYSGPQTSNPTRANKIVVRKGIAFFYII